MAPTSPRQKSSRRRRRRGIVARRRRRRRIVAPTSRGGAPDSGEAFYVSRPRRSSGSPRSWRSEFSASGRSRPAAPRYSRREAGRQSRPRRAPRRRRDPAAASTPQPRGDGATAPLRRRYSLPRRRRDRSAALPSRRRLDQAASSERLPSRRRLDQAAASPQSLHGVLAITRRDRDRAQVRDGATKLNIFNACDQNSCEADEYCCTSEKSVHGKCDRTNCEKKRDLGGQCSQDDMCKSGHCPLTTHVHHSAHVNYWTGTCTAVPCTCEHGTGCYDSEGCSVDDSQSPCYNTPSRGRRRKSLIICVYHLHRCVACDDGYHLNTYHFQMICFKNRP